MYSSKGIATCFLVRLLQSKAVNLKGTERLQVPKIFYSLCADEIPSASVVGLGGHYNPLIYQKQLFGIFFFTLFLGCG